ncbi:Acyl-CoA N-acyltransferases (NAT) superfamily protein [Thalictrum thalictroides]|uniref:Acyl-CoA N-acyltransferases (NAT) superfamily protein n=1 Tax=Thalictrum thalictroides TaxID=46969 RepID=A0A7J6WS78_THATH|nr:Acyl-CoA N-acyltransferases (NAT) superfamily protein [Thalictrum thalictroides]
MAATISFSFFCLDRQQQQQEKSFFSNTHFLKPPQTLSFTSITRKSSLPFQNFPKFGRFNLIPSFSSDSSLHESSSSSSGTYLIDPLRTGRFLTTKELEKLQILENFRYLHDFESGSSLCVRIMRQEEMDITVGLLSESFGESMSLPFKYVNLLGYLVKQYMIERRALMPHTATLIGYYREGDEEEEIMAGTVEISFDKKGANASPPSPTPPKESPYICNMTVKKPLRRRGIGWHLLKACEELICQMGTSREVYLHCRIIDAAPFNMYTKAGYNVIKTDNVFILLTLQRRKHLMCKKLPVINSTSDSDISYFDSTLTSNVTSDLDISSLDSDISSGSTSELEISSFEDNIIL